jgi:D-3-phosphoglycerate dehydrogenase
MKLINLEPGQFSDYVVQKLKKFFTYSELKEEQSLLSAVNGNEVLLTKLQYCISRTVLESAPSIKYVVTPTTGLTHVDMDFACSHGITVVSLKNDYAFLQGITATAELTWGLLLSLSRGIPSAIWDVNETIWNRKEHIGFEVSGKTLGILGLGRLGSLVADYGKAFRMNVIASDPCPSCGNKKGVVLLPMEEVLAKSDYLSIHVDLNKRTRGLIGSRELALMKDGAFLINTSRGEVVDEEALLDALVSGKLAGAALDVLSDEFSQNEDWVSKSKLIEYSKTHDNLVITPHIGGATRESMEKADRRIVDLLLQATRLKGTETCQDCLDV